MKYVKTFESFSYNKNETYTGGKTEYTTPNDITRAVRDERTFPMQDEYIDVYYGGEWYNQVSVDDIDWVDAYDYSTEYPVVLWSDTKDMDIIPNDNIPDNKSKDGSTFRFRDKQSQNDALSKYKITKVRY